MALTLRYAARSDVGHLREGNEDSGYASPHLLVVADGMGGAAAGEVASSVAVSAMASLDEDEPSGDVLETFATTRGSDREPAGGSGGDRTSTARHGHDPDRGTALMTADWGWFTSATRVVTC